MEGFNPNKIKTEDLEFKGTDENGVLIYGDEGKPGHATEHDPSEVEQLLHYIKTSKAGFDIIETVKRKIDRMVNEGTDRESILNDLEENLLSKFQEYVQRVQNRNLIEDMKRSLVKMGIDSDKLLVPDKLPGDMQRHY